MDDLVLDLLQLPRVLCALQHQPGPLLSSCSTPPLPSTGFSPPTPAHLDDLVLDLLQLPRVLCALQHQLGLFFLQLRPLPGDHDAQQLVLEAVKCDHEVDQSDLDRDLGQDEAEEEVEAGAWAAAGAVAGAAEKVVPRSEAATVTESAWVADLGTAAPACDCGAAPCNCAGGGNGDQKRGELQPLWTKHARYNVQSVSVQGTQCERTTHKV
eukprot:356328-Chlamydomonas_euryale.AAC.3